MHGENERNRANATATYYLRLRLALSGTLARLILRMPYILKLLMLSDRALHIWGCVVLQNTL